MKVNKIQNMKKSTLLVFFLLAIMLTSISKPVNVNAGAPQEYPVDLNILIYYNSQEPFRNGFTGFTGNYTAGGNSVNVVDSLTWDFKSDDLSSYDVVYISEYGFNGPLSNVFNPEVAAIKTWFDTGNKTLWIAGNDDFAGNWVANQTNPLLEALGTPLRFDAGGLLDPGSNDGGGAYRLIANTVGPTSNLVDNVTQGFQNMVFHGSTAISYYNDSQYLDLRNQSVPSTIEIVIYTSPTAYVADQDASVGIDDVYAYDATSGSYPILVVDRNASTSNSMLVLSGESSFSDYKNMYGNTWEKEQLSHQGSMIVDNLLTYYFVKLLGMDSIHLILSTQTITSTQTETATQTTTSNATETTVIFSATQTVTDTVTQVYSETVTLTQDNGDTYYETQTTTLTITVTSDGQTSSTPTEASVPLPSIGFFLITILLVVGIRSFRKRFGN